MLSLYRALFALRRAEPALSVGRYGEVKSTESLLIYERRHRQRRLLIALNMGGECRRLPIKNLIGKVLLSTTMRNPCSISIDMALEDGEGWIVGFD